MPNSLRDFHRRARAAPARGANSLRCVRCQFDAGRPSDTSPPGFKLPYPKFINDALPGKRPCGQCPDDLPDPMRAYCERMAKSPGG